MHGAEPDLRRNISLERRSCSCWLSAKEIEKYYAVLENSTAAVHGGSREEAPGDTWRTPVVFRQDYRIFRMNKNESCHHENPVIL
jgi:hypothetical protein